MLVTIGSLCYNNSKTVIHTLNSIAAQTHDEIELFVIDDCSKDDSVEIIKEWIRGYQGKVKISFFQNDQNKGVISGVRKIIDLATGEIIIFFSGDDFYEKTRIANVVKAFQEATSEYGFLYSDAKVADPNGNVINNSYFDHFNLHAPGAGYLYDKLIESNFIPAVALAYRKECIFKIKENIKDVLFEDYQMTLLSSKLYKALFIATNDVCYRVHNVSTMNTRFLEVMRDKIYFLMTELDSLSNGATRTKLRSIVQKELIQFIKFKQGAFTEKDYELAKKANSLKFYFPAFFIKNLGRNRILNSILYRYLNFYAKS